LEGILLLALNGSIILGEESAFLQKTFADLLERGQRNVVADLKHVARIDSTGLGTLVYGHTKFVKAGGALKLLNLSKRHIELLVLTKLSTIFEIYDDEQNAVDSFFPDRRARKFDILTFVRQHDIEP